MNNVFEINTSGAVKLFPLMISILKEEPECSFETPLSQDNLNEIKNLLIKAYTCTRSNLTIEKIQELIDNAFVSNKKYSSLIKRVDENHTLIDILVICSNNSMSNLARDGGGYYGNSTGVAILTMPDPNYLYMRVGCSTNHIGGGDNCVSYYNKEKKELMGETSYLNLITGLYNKVNPSCANIAFTETFNPKNGRREGYIDICFTSTVEEGFAVQAPSRKFGRGVNSKTCFIYKSGYGFLYFNSNHKKLRASIVHGNLLLRDANDILDERYIAELTNMSLTLAVPCVFVFNKFIPYLTRNEFNYGAGFNQNKHRTIIINSVPKEFVVQTKNVIPIKQEDVSAFLYDVLVKNKNLYSKWLTNKIITTGNYPIEITSVFEEGEDNLLFMLESANTVLAALGNRNTETYQSFLNNLYSSSKYIQMLKDINEGTSIIDTWFRQCCEQGEKNKGKLIENYKIMRDRLAKEKVETTIYLNHHDFSKCLPIPSFTVKDISIDNIKDRIGFNMLGITYTKLGKIDIQPLEEKKLFVRAVINASPRARSFNDRHMEKIIDVDIINFYNQKDNAIVISQEKLKEEAK